MSFFATRFWGEYLQKIKDINLIQMGEIQLVKNQNELGRSFSNYLELDLYHLNKKNIMRLSEFAQFNDIDAIHFRVSPAVSSGLIPFKDLLRNGWTFYCGTTFLLDLKEELAILKKNIRKSNKALINKFDRMYEVQIVDCNNSSKILFKKWANLYGSCLSGVDEDRYEKIFKYQYNMIVNKKAILVMGFEKEICLGGMFFFLDSEYTSYALSANNKNYDNIGCYLMWRSIKYLKKTGFTYLELGGLSYNNQIFCEFELKNSNITFFKEGVGAQMTPTFFFSKFFKDKAKEKYLSQIRQHFL